MIQLSQLVLVTALSFGCHAPAWPKGVPSGNISPRLQARVIAWQDTLRREYDYAGVVPLAPFPIDVDFPGWELPCSLSVQFSTDGVRWGPAAKAVGTPVQFRTEGDLDGNGFPNALDLARWGSAQARGPEYKRAR